MFKNLAGRSLVACPNFEHCIYFSLSAGNHLGQTDFNHTDIVKKNYLVPTTGTEQNLQRLGKKYLGNEDANSSLLMLFIL
jgi:hypothetical protein